MLKKFKWFMVMGAIPLPWLALTVLGIGLGPLGVVALTGLAIMSAAFILTWSAEAAEHDLAGPFVLLLLALIAVLPEYAIDGTLAWNAGKDASFAPFAMANMTGANRLLIGLGWTSVFFVFYFVSRKKRGKGAKSDLLLPATQRLDCSILFFATVYAFIIAFKGYLAWYDAAVLFGIFGFYFLRVIRLNTERVAVIGPAKAIAGIPSKKARTITWILCMAYAAVAIFLSAEPFAHGLIDVGESFNIDKFLLVQWLAPLASEAPEFVIAIIFVLRLSASKGFGLIVSSQVNQWTLLIGTIPIMFMISRGAFGSFLFDTHQAQELYLTAAQSLFAITLLANLRLSLKEALLVAALFLTQFFLTDETSRKIFIFIYLGMAAFNILRTPRASIRTWKIIFKSLYCKVP